MEYFNIFTIEESIVEWEEVTENQKLNLNNLFDDFMSDTINKRYYLNIKEEPEHILTNLYKENKTPSYLEKVSNKLAKKLLEAEQIHDKDGKIRRNKTIKSGVLIFKATSDYLILMKLEMVDAIDPKDFSRTEIFGGEKPYFKIAKMEFKEKNEDELELDIYDTGAKVAKYWTEKLLTVTPKRNDELNTSDLIEFLREKKLFKENLEVNLDDLTNFVDKYLSNNTNFSFENLSYHVNADFKTDFKTTELFSSDTLLHMDSDFNIDKSVLSKYLHKNIYISEGIHLDIDNYVAVIGRGQLELSSDEQYIKIRIEEGNVNEIKDQLPNI